MKRFLTLFAVLLSVVFTANAQKAQKAEIERLRKEIAQIDKQLKANSSKSADATAQLAITRKKISATKQLVAESEKEIKSIQKDISDKQKDIRETQALLDDNLTYYESLVKSAYLSRDTRLRFLYVLSGKSLTQIVRRYSYLRTASDNLRAESVKIASRKEQLGREKAQLDSMHAECSLMLKARSKELENLKSVEQKEQKLINDLQKNRKQYQAQIKKKKGEIEALNKKIEQIIAQQAKKNKGNRNSPETNAFASRKGYLPWPVEGTVVGRYGKHKHPVYKNIDLPFNNGINISTAAGEKVKAVADGVVTQLAVMPGYNQCVLVQHGDYFTFYCKLKEVTLKAGDKVKAGSIIGTVDTIGGETQLHFQLWKGTKSQDPEPWLQ